VAAKAKELRYAIDLGATGALRTEDGTVLEPPAGWTPEHLLLAALARCSLESLRYHADRCAAEVSMAHAAARGAVTRREDDGRYALVEAALELDVRLAPEPAGDDLDALLAKAERDCFVGASLRVTPSYRWTVNGVVRSGR
jgi:organic hydroperoxide reductase OsmC/OhrA